MATNLGFICIGKFKFNFISIMLITKEKVTKQLYRKLYADLDH